MRLLITGANGLLGACLCRSMEPSGHTIIATSRHGGGETGGPFQIGCELSNGLEVDRLFQENHIDVVIHCAASIRKDDPFEFYLDNVKATNNLAECARKYGVSRFIYMSTISVYHGNGPFSETSGLHTSGGYEASKISGEISLQLAASDSFKVMVLRLAGLHGGARKGGVVNSMIDAALSGKQIAVDEPDTVQGITFLEDLDTSVGVILSREWRDSWAVYNLANPESCSLADMGKLVLHEAAATGCLTSGSGAARNRSLVVDKIHKDYGINLASVPQRLAEMTVKARQKLNQDRN
jgi:2-alkyl-3-oxoalkanoate reductase